MPTTKNFAALVQRHNPEGLDAVTNDEGRLFSLHLYCLAYFMGESIPSSRRMFSAYVKSH